MAKYATREGFVLIKAESTYGADPTPTVADNELYVDAVEIEVTRPIIDRDGPSPYRPGYPGVPGPQAVTVSIKTEITPKAITGTGVRPKETDALKFGGWMPTESVAGNPKTVTYALKSGEWGQTAGQESSVTVWVPIFNAADDDGIVLKASGCRGDTVLTIEGGTKWGLEVSGPGASGTKARINSSRSSFGLPTFDFTTLLPIVAGAAECTITAITAAETYPVASGLVRSLKFSANNNVTVDQGVCGQRVSMQPGAATFELVLDVVDLDEWDPQQYLGDSEAGAALVPDALLVQVGTPDLDFNASTGVPTVAGTYVMFRFYAQITAAKMGDVGGSKAWTISGRAIYAPGAGTAGQTPSDGLANLIFGTLTA